MGLHNSDLRPNQLIRLPVQPDAEGVKFMTNRWALIEERTRQSLGKRITAKTYCFAKVVGFDTAKGLWLLQAYTKRGDTNGKPSAEGFDDVWVLPEQRSVVVYEGEEFEVKRYCKSSQTVE